MVLFHLKPQECKPGIMPTALKELLLDTSVQLADFSVRSEPTHPCDSYSVEGTGAVDVDQLSARHLGVNVGYARSKH
ncbi:unnamed protein product [Sphacelaria rigidula]